MIESTRMLIAALVASLLIAGCGQRGDSPTQPDNGQPAATTEATAAPQAGGGEQPPPLPMADSGFTIVVEAEDATEVSAPMSVSELDEVSGGKAVTIPREKDPENPSKPEASLRYTVNLPEAAEAHIWCRVYFHSECENSFIAKLPGAPPSTVGDSTYNHWHWVKMRGPAVELDSGASEIVIEGREYGAWIDQLLLTSDADYVPVGIEQ